jgi:hypothetical protein
MKTHLLLAGSFMLAASVYSLPTYDNFSTYGTPGTWTEVSGPPIVSYTTSAPLLGGNTSPSGESWLLYTNAPPTYIYSNWWAGSNWNGIASQNVAIVNYFGAGQPGASDTPAPNLPSGFPGPFVAGNDTRTNSVWTPGWAQTGLGNVENYLGGVGACLQFANPVPGTTGNKVFVSFFVDVPDCTGSYGNGQSGLHGYTAGFINSGELPTNSANQYALPGFAPYTGYASVPLLEKFQPRAKSGSTAYWYPGVGDGVASGNYNSIGLTTAGPSKSIHFCVMSYEWNGGVGSDLERVWIDPVASTFGTNVEPFATPPLTASTYVNHTCTVALPDVGGFFFLANTQDGGGTPNSGVIFNSLSIGTNWAYVTGGAQFTSYAPATTNIASGQTLVLNSTAVAGGGVTPTYAWQTNNGVNSGPLIVGGRFAVGPTGALTISNVQSADAGTYTVQVSTAITTENSVAPITAQTVVTVTAPPTPPNFTAVSGSGLGSGQFQVSYTGSAGSTYRIWSSTNAALSPVTNTWTLLTNGTFASGTNSFTDTTATNSAQYYIITVP